MRNTDNFFNHPEGRETQRWSLFRQALEITENLSRLKSLSLIIEVCNTHWDCLFPRQGLFMKAPSSLVKCMTSCDCCINRHEQKQFGIMFCSALNGASYFWWMSSRLVPVVPTLRCSEAHGQRQGQGGKPGTCLNPISELVTLINEILTSKYKKEERSGREV
jgi:hypothetical protein